MKKLALLATTLLLGLFAAECALRVFFPPFGREPVEKVHWLVEDPVAGWMNLPGFQHPGHPELVINDHGLRGPPIDDPKPTGGLRILCVGDSSTFGIHGRLPDVYLGNYPELLAERLAAIGTHGIEVINAGVIGQSSAHGLRFLTTRALELEPDIITIRFGYNDHADAWNPPLRTREIRWVPLRTLVDWTHDTQLTRLVMSAWQSRPDLHPTFLSVPWVDEDEFAYNLGRMAEFARDNEIHLLFIDYPLRKLERGGDERDLTIVKLAGMPSLEAFHQRHARYQEIVARVARQEGIPLIRTESRLRSANPPGFSDSDFVHPSPVGTRIIADAILEGLLELDWIPAANLPPGDRGPHQ
jgi:lysophospholipase L1-like esterase